MGKLCNLGFSDETQGKLRSSYAENPSALLIDHCQARQQMKTFLLFSSSPHLSFFDRFSHRLTSGGTILFVAIFPAAFLFGGSIPDRGWLS
jgi:hypothetical protein